MTSRAARHSTRRWLDELRREVDRLRNTICRSASAADIVEGLMS